MCQNDTTTLDRDAEKKRKTMNKKNKQNSIPRTLRECEEKYGPRPESYDEYYYHFQSMVAAMDEELGQEDADQIICMSVNDMRRVVMIRQHPTQH